MTGTVIISDISLSTRSPVGSYVFLSSSPTNTSACQRGSISMKQFVGVVDELYIFSQTLAPNDISYLSNP